MTHLHTTTAAAQAASKTIAPARARDARRAPGPRGNWLLGSAGALQRDPLAFYTSMAQRFGEVVRTRLLSFPTFLVFHPDGVQHVLQEQHQHYDRQLFLYRALRPFFGEGLATSDGPSWLQHRRLMQPAFHRKLLAALGTQMTAAIGDMLTCWQTSADPPGGVPLDAAAHPAYARPGALQRRPLR